jgi:hypothetical protein
LKNTNDLKLLYISLKNFFSFVQSFTFLNFLWKIQTKIINLKISSLKELEPPRRSHCIAKIVNSKFISWNFKFTKDWNIKFKHIHKTLNFQTFMNFRVNEKMLKPNKNSFWKKIEFLKYFFCFHLLIFQINLKNLKNFF